MENTGGQANELRHKDQTHLYNELLIMLLSESTELNVSMSETWTSPTGKPPQIYPAPKF